MPPWPLPPAVTADPTMPAALPGVAAARTGAEAADGASTATSAGQAVAPGATEAPTHAVPAARTVAAGAETSAARAGHAARAAEAAAMASVAGAARARVAAIESAAVAFVAVGGPFTFARCAATRRALLALPDRQRQRLHAGAAQPLDDVGIDAAQFAADRARQLGLQHLADLGAFADRGHALDQRMADDLRPQRVAHGRLADLAKQRADVAIKLAQLPLAAGDDVGGESLGRDLALDLLVLDQRERVPVRGLRQLLAGRLRLPGDPLVEGLVERQRERSALAVELELRREQVVPAHEVGRRQRCQPQALHRAVGRRSHSELEAVGSGFQLGGKPSVNCGFHGQGDGRSSMRQPPTQVVSRCGGEMGF